MSEATRAVIALLAALLAGLVLPALAIAALAPTLAATPRATAQNFRGRTVFLGLGAVWVVWSVAVALTFPLLERVGWDVASPLLVAAVVLVLAACAVGLVDDALGSPEARGFRGHLRAIARGRLTTGGLKLLVIGLASLFAAGAIHRVAGWGALTLDGGVASLMRILGAGAAIALSSNLSNLFDLRPGRALKTGSLFALLGVASVALSPHRAALLASSAPGGSALLVAGVLALLALGPIAAVWRYDLGERGMLGDAGANPLGALAGLLIVAGAGDVLLGGFLVVVLLLNVLSEKVSFSRIIESDPVLRVLDGLGRAPAEPPEALGKG